MSDRGTGRSTRAMQNAPRGAVYVWCNGDLHYPKALARHLGRDDLSIWRLSDLSENRVAGRDFVAVVIDHAARLPIDGAVALEWLRHRGVQITFGG